MPIEATLTAVCETCGVLIAVPWRWGVGVIVPKPSQVRIQLLNWSEENGELIDIKMQPDVGALILCEDCRAELMAEIMAAVLRLQDKKPVEKREEMVH